MASKGIKTRPNSELAMMTNVYRRWIEINGDEPIRTYSSRHADKYIELMSRIPGNYGKGKTKELTVDELIKYAKRNRIKALLTTKTIKNHFSKLSILWTFYGKKELVDRGSNVFQDWSFGRKQKGDGYIAWPEEDMRKLIEAGILEWAENAKYYLFDELTFSGRDKKRSVGFGGKFSTFKNRLGIKSSSVVFHSFRHNVSTRLRNMPGGNTGIRELWIDDFLAHEYGHQSEGVKRYLDGIDLENIVQVAEGMDYPDFWDIKKLT